MKQKSQNRFLAALLAVAMMLQMLPMLAFADTGEKDVAWIGKKGYKSLEAAISAAGDGATIKLGEGVYLLGDTKQKVTKKEPDLCGRWYR